MNKILPWLRANIVTVIVLAVMLAAAVALPMVSSRMNAGVKAEVEKRAQRFSELDKVSKTQVPWGQSGVVNRQFLDQYKEFATQVSAEAERMREIAIQHNRRDRDVLMSEMFPKPVAQWDETVRFQFYEKLMAAYRDLLTEVNAGSAATPDEVTTQLDQRRELFLSEAGVGDIKELDDEQRTQLHDELTQARLAMYGERARQLTMYAELTSLNPPAWDPLKPADLPIGQWFIWQWDLWIKQDIMRALHHANTAGSESNTVLEAPVKRVLSVSVREDDVVKSLAAPASASTAGGTAGRGGMGGFGGATTDGRTGVVGAEDAAAAGAGATPPNPKAQAPVDFNVSFTGRTTNSLYDIKIVDLELIVDSTAVPAIVDALAQQNFMTILDLRMEQIDPFEAARGGYVFGQAPLSYLNLVIESVWLREWTSQLMPDDLKKALKLPVEQPPAAAPTA